MLTHSMTKKHSVNIIVWGILSFSIGKVILIEFGNRGTEDFKPYIAECRAMDDVNIIVEGRLYKKDKKLRGAAKSFVSMNNMHVDASEPDPIYVFKSKFGYKGVSPVHRFNRFTGFGYIVRDGEAPPNVVGKDVLLCMTGFRPYRIKAIYIED